MATNFGQNWQNDLHLAGWRSERGRNMAVSSQKIFSGNIVATSCANMIKLGPVTPEIARVTTAPFWTRRKKSTYPTEYLGNYTVPIYTQRT